MATASIKTTHPLPSIGLIVIFLSLLIALNLGLHTLLKPEGVFVTQLPYSTQSLEGWQSVSGNWQASNGLIQQLEQGRALITSPLQLSTSPRQNEVIRVHIRLEPNAGLSFGMLGPNTLEASHILFLADRNLVAAYMNSEGKLETQASLPLAESLGKERAVTIHLKGTSYDVFLEHELVLSNLALEAKGTYLGLIAEGQTQLHGLVVDTVPQATVSTTSVTLPPRQNKRIDFNFALDQNWSILSGEWSITQGQLQQSTKEGFDHIIMFPAESSKQTLELELNHQTGFGGGLVFNSPAQESKANAHMVRFHEEAGQRQLLWGYFNDNVEFVSQGSLAFIEASNKQTLRVQINELNYNLWVNDQLLVQDIPLHSSQGYLGLTSSQSNVNFMSLRFKDTP